MSEDIRPVNGEGSSLSRCIARSRLDACQLQRYRPIVTTTGARALSCLEKKSWSFSAEWNLTVHSIDRQSCSIKRRMDLHFRCRRRSIDRNNVSTNMAKKKMQTSSTSWPHGFGGVYNTWFECVTDKRYCLGHLSLLHNNFLGKNKNKSSFWVVAAITRRVQYISVRILFASWLLLLCLWAVDRILLLYYL